MNTGGPAFHGTLLDWMAGQALNGYLAGTNPDADLEAFDQTRVAKCCYSFASAMLAEKARREADHSGDANKMVPDPFAETALRRLAADVLPADIKDAANEERLTWCAEQVRARVNTLEALNRELVEALDAIVTITDRDHVWWIKARAALAKAKGGA